MRVMRRIIFVFVFTVVGFAVNAQNLTILHMNDTHSHIEAERSGKNCGFGGVIEQAAYIDSVRFADGTDNVMLLHAGDFSQGTSYFTELNGDVEIAVLNAMEFDAVCLGNHEFETGIDELARRLSGLNLPVVCANYDFSETPLGSYVKPYAIVEKAGRKIGVIGLLTDLSSVVNKDIALLLKYQHPAEIADKYASELRKKGCDLVICLTHLGVEGLSYTDMKLAAETQYVDVIVGGHSHTFLDDMEKVVNKTGKEVIIVTDGKWGLNVGKLTVKRGR